jgi:hypothetical protein
VAVDLQAYIEGNVRAVPIVSEIAWRNVMPLTVTEGLPTILVRKDAFERAALNRTEIDSLFNLTDAEFRVEGGLVAIGPLPSDDMVGLVTGYFESKGLVYYDEFFEMSGNWPEWLRLYAM